MYLAAYLERIVERLDAINQNVLGLGVRHTSRTTFDPTGTTGSAGSLASVKPQSARSAGVSVSQLS
jgi:hypothetical protein